MIKLSKDKESRDSQDGRLGRPQDHLLSWLHQNYNNGTPLQYSCLENPMGGGAWRAAVHGVARSRTRLSDFTFTFHFHALEKEMATHSSVLAWRIPGTGEPGELPSMGLHRVGHDWSDLAAAANHTNWQHLLHLCRWGQFPELLQIQKMIAYKRQEIDSHSPTFWSWFPPSSSCMI